MAGHYERTDEVKVPESTRNFWSDLIDLSSGLPWERPTFLCLLTSNRYIPIKICWAEVLSCFVRVGKYSHFL